MHMSYAAVAQKCTCLVPPPPPPPPASRFRGARTHAPPQPTSATYDLGCRRIKYTVTLVTSTGAVPASTIPNPTACLQRDGDFWCWDEGETLLPWCMNILASFPDPAFRHLQDSKAARKGLGFFPHLSDWKDSRKGSTVCVCVYTGTENSKSEHVAIAGWAIHEMQPFHCENFPIPHYIMFMWGMIPSSFPFHSTTSGRKLGRGL